MSDVALQIVLSAQDKTGTALDSAEGRLGKLGKAAGVAWGALGGATATALIGSLSDVARAAAEDEASVARLQTAIENTGASFDDYADQVSAVIKKGQDLAFTDDQTRDALARMAATTGSAQKAISLLTTAEDLARGKKIDLATASEVVGKVAAGNTAILSRYGIVLDKNASAEDALAALQKKFAGQAETYGATTEASIFKVHDAIDEWREGIGTAMGPAMGLVGLLPGLTSGMTLAGGAIGGLSSLIKLTFIPSLVAMAVPFLPIILALAAIGVAVFVLAKAWENNWGDIRGKTEAVVTFLGGIFDGFKLLVLFVFKAIVLGVATAINTVIGVINTFIGAYDAVAERLGLPLIGKIELITPNLSAVDAEIDRVARSRTATIYANVYEQAIAGGGGVRQFAEGTSYVPYTGLAIVHQGERIIPAEQNVGDSGMVENHIHVEVDGREIAYAVQSYSRVNQRRSGVLLDPSAI